jgi:hypothetical protein
LHAAVASLSFAGMSVSLWPVPSHHYFALVAGFAALLAVSADVPSRRAWFTAGLLVGICGMTLQPEGAVFLVLLAARLLSSAKSRNRPDIVSMGIGIAVPLLTFIVVLAARGVVSDAFFHVVIWPAHYYKQAGSFNDAAGDGFTIIADAVSGVVNRGKLATAYWQLVAPLLLMGALVLRVLGSRNEGDRARWIPGFAGCSAIWLVFLRGRIDLVHLLAFFGPIFTLLLMMQVDWRAGALRWIVSAWLLAAFGIMAIRWSTEWVQRPPSLHAVASVDSAFATTPIPSIVDSLPGARAGRLPVLYLSHEASSLYFFWGPAIPPSTWLLPPSLPLNSPRDYAAFVRVAERGRLIQLHGRLAPAKSPLIRRDRTPPPRFLCHNGARFSPAPAAST